MNLESLRNSEVVVVGSGFFGLTIAERVANNLNKKVCILESRDHFGGNAHAYFDEISKIEIHKYGSHLFHTNSEKIWEYVNRFTKFNSYSHRVYGISQGEILTLPVNLQTLSQLYPDVTSIDSAIELVKGFKAAVDDPEENLESKARSMVGEAAYERVVKHYTQKQWQTDPKELPAETISRLPIRLNLDNRYFTDKYQGLPIDGYTAWQASMLESENITLCLNSDFFLFNNHIEPSQIVVYTGAIDRYFDFKYGQLGWRTLDFEIENLEINDYQGSAVINYLDEEPKFTRIHEFKHMHPERQHAVGKTVIMKEFSRFANESDEPYYPINRITDREILNLYRRDAKNEQRVLFGGRLGSYQYLDMHMAIGSALTMFENEVIPMLSAG